MWGGTFWSLISLYGCEVPALRDWNGGPVSRASAVEAECPAQKWSLLTCGSMMRMNIEISLAGSARAPRHTEWSRLYAAARAKPRPHS